MDDGGTGALLPSSSSPRVSEEDVAASTPFTRVSYLNRFDSQRKRGRNTSPSSGSPGYEDLSTPVVARTSRSVVRRKRLARWFRSNLRLRSPWAITLLFLLLVPLLFIIYTWDSFSTNTSESKPPVIDSLGPAAALHERLRGGKLFNEYDGKISQIDKVNAGATVIEKKSSSESKNSAPERNIEQIPAEVLATTESLTESTNESQSPSKDDEPLQAAEFNKSQSPNHEIENVTVITTEEPTTTTTARIKEAKATAADIGDFKEVLPPISVPKVRLLKDEKFALQWQYIQDEKLLPYVGATPVLERLYPNETLPTKRSSEQAAALDKALQYNTPRVGPLYYNALAVFPGYDANHQHGRIGVHLNGTRGWLPKKPMPPPADQVPGGLDKALEKGGFYLNLSDALPLERDTLDGRPDICKSINYDSHKLGDAAVIITYYNEPFSTLLRSVHSVLNQTPPELLREVILVNDHSTEGCIAGSLIDEYIKLLPKVKLVHLAERRGLVTARLVGIKMATAPSVVILDSHIELNKGWLEPQLQRLYENPKSVVFPQIFSIDSTNFNYMLGSGIGTFLSFKWMIQERAYAPGVPKETDPVVSPSMAGGLFAVRRDWFWEVGGFDDEFEMWGAENVEFPIRVWMCSGRVEGIPCAMTYHIYRMKGSGYSSPSDAVIKNRLRTARLWMDEYYQMAKAFIANDADTRDIGSFDRMIALRERLKCKDFRWFMDNIATIKWPRKLEDVQLLGEVKSKAMERFCLDNMQGRIGDAIGIYPCHGLGGSQAFMTFKGQAKLFIGGDESKCVSGELKQQGDCDNPEVNREEGWEIDFERGLIKYYKNATADRQCLAIRTENGKPELLLEPCGTDPDVNEQWQLTKFTPDPNFERPTYSPARQAYNKRREAWAAF